MDFTPKQLHYFKRELITHQLDKEILSLISSPDISSLLDNNEKTDFPFLRYIFHNIIIDFPLLKHTCDDAFWPKCKILLNEFNKIQLDSYYAPRHTDATVQRKAFKHKIQKSLVFAFCACIKTIQGQEESIKVTTDTPPTLVVPQVEHHNNNTLKVNIVTVREVKEKKSFREVSHAEFLLETYLPHHSEPVYVARRHGEFRKLRDQLKHHFKSLDFPLVPGKSVNTHHQDGYRENDRLLLRAWLHQLITKGQVAKSSALIKFLTQNPITFSPEEEKDTLQREEADKNRLMEQEKFQRELDKRVHELNETLDVLKKEIIQPGGLIQVFDVIKKTKEIQDLPESLKKAFEWGRINFAFALHRQFLTSDTASENLNNLRRTHGLMPYKTMSVILRFSNPMSMVKSILDLFLAQPFGGRSLFQRIIISNMNEESKSFQKDIEVLEKKVNDKSICKKIYNAVRTPLPAQTNFRDYDSSTLELLALLGNDEIEPLLSAEQITLIADFDSSHEGKKLIKHGVQLWELYARQYEQELMMNLVFQGVTGELLKEFISVFYQPLAQVYKAADISTTIRHVANFIDDLITVIDDLQDRDEEVEENVSDTIQLFIDLVARHEQHFYEFVHNVHSQEASKVFDELIQYVDKLFTFVAHGIPGKMDINHCIERAGIESRDEIDSLEKEIDAVCDYRYRQKMYHFERQRRKMMIQSGGITSNREDIFQFIPKSSEMMGALQDFDELEYDVDYEEGKEEFSSTTSSSSSDNNSEYDDASSGSSIPSRRSSKSSGSHLSHAGLDKPVLTLIPKIVPYFVQDVHELMVQHDTTIQQSS
ncbi:unnamed protein product [Mucor hiemalis]